MKYCCKEFEIKAETHDGFYQQEDGTWGIWGCLIYMKCCPFCGKALAPRFILKEDHNSDDISWAVWDTLRNRIVGYFDTLKPAEEMLRKAND